MKKTFYTEVSYIVAMIVMAIGAAFSARADLGMSMVVAPAYILHLSISRVLPFFTFGMAEYLLQALMIVVMSLLLRKIKLGYVLSIATAVLYGLLLDAVMIPVSFLPADQLWQRIIWFVIGTLCCSAAVSMFFHTYISPEAYELVVKEVSANKGIDINKFKTGYDLVSLTVAIVMSFVFFGFGKFEGIGIGTVITAFVNGCLIGMISGWLEKKFEFRDGMGWRKIFER